MKTIFFYFIYESFGTLESFTLFVKVKTSPKLSLEHNDEFEIEVKNSGRVHVLRTTQNLVISRCCFAENYNARAQPSFCSLINILFSDVPDAIAVVVF